MRVLRAMTGIMDPRPPSTRARPQWIGSAQSMAGCGRTPSGLRWNPDILLNRVVDTAANVSTCSGRHMEGQFVSLFVAPPCSRRGGWAPTATDGENGKRMCEVAFRDAEADGPDGKQMERPSWCWIRPWPAVGVFLMAFLCVCVIGIAVVHLKLRTQPQANKETPRSHWHRGERERALPRSRRRGGEEGVVSSGAATRAGASASGAESPGAASGATADGAAPSTSMVDGSGGAEGRREVGRGRREGRRSRRREGWASGGDNRREGRCSRQSARQSAGSARQSEGDRRSASRRPEEDQKKPEEEAARRVRDVARVGGR